MGLLNGLFGGKSKRSSGDVRSTRYVDFTDNGDGTVTDTLTGLMWSADAFAPTARDACRVKERTRVMTWQEAAGHIACLNKNHYLGHNDWRLPTIDELKTLMDYFCSFPHGKNLFYGVQPCYWSSTTYVDNTDHAWYFSHGGLKVDEHQRKSFTACVWPVRSV